MFQHGFMKLFTEQNKESHKPTVSKTLVETSAQWVIAKLQEVSVYRLHML